MSLGNRYIPLIAFIGGGCPVLVLFVWRHRIPFLGLLVVPPPVVEECAWILDKLREI